MLARVIFNSNNKYFHYFLLVDNNLGKSNTKDIQRTNFSLRIQNTQTKDTERTSYIFPGPFKGDEDSSKIKIKGNKRRSRTTERKSQGLQSNNVKPMITHLHATIFFRFAPLSLSPASFSTLPSGVVVSGLARFLPTALPPLAAMSSCRS